MALLLLLTVTQVTGLLLSLFMLPAGTQFGLSLDGLESLELWRFTTFGFSCFSPGDVDQPGYYASLLASIVLYCLSVTAVTGSAPIVEARLGRGGLAIACGAVLAVQAMLSVLVMSDATAFSPVGLVFMLTTCAWLADFEQGRDRTGRTADLRLLVVTFSALLVCVCAAFDAGARPLLAGLACGPLAGFLAFALKRRIEIRGVQRYGRGEVAGMLYADDTELLTTGELRERTDELLEKISLDGIDSLSQQQKVFLERASQRLKRTGSGAL